MNVKKVSVLLIGNKWTDFRAIRLLLNNAEGSYVLHLAKSIEESLRTLITHPADVIVIDLLPGIQGLNALEELRAHVPKTPLIALTKVEHQTLAFECLKKGALDYLFHGMDVHAWDRCIRYVLEDAKIHTMVRELESPQPR